jgi:hypothetical protein
MKHLRRSVLDGACADSAPLLGCLCWADIPSWRSRSEAGVNPALSRNCEAPPGDEPGRLLYVDERQLSTEERFAREARRPSAAESGGRKVDPNQFAIDRNAPPSPHQSAAPDSVCQPMLRSRQPAI